MLTTPQQTSSAWTVFTTTFFGGRFWPVK